MAYDLYYTMLFVDQGMGNLVSSCDVGKTDVLYTALIDFGSSASSKASETIPFMLEYFARNIAAKKKYDIDLLVLSHSDRDHWNLTGALIDGFKEQFKRDMTIKCYAYGGSLADYKAKGATNLMAWLASQSHLRGVPQGESSAYSAAAALTALDSFPDTNPEIAFMPAIVNAASTASATTSIGYNVVSMTVGVTILPTGTTPSLCAFLFPGDMTSESAAALLKHEATAKELVGVAAMSVPHHGSSASFADEYVKFEERDYSIAKNFAKFVSAKSIGASAGFHSIYKHPHRAVLDIFQNLATFTYNHTYVAYKADNSGYDAFQAADARYTNYVAMNADRKSGTPMRIMFKLSQGVLSVVELNPDATKAPPQPGVEA